MLKLKRVEPGVAWSGRLSYQNQVQNLLKPDDVGHAVANGVYFSPALLLKFQIICLSYLGLAITWCGALLFCIAQNSLAGKGKGISHEMITLDIESSKVPELTLIDLPGIARVATGDQPVDIEKQVRADFNKIK